MNPKELDAAIEEEIESLIVRMRMINVTAYERDILRQAVMAGITLAVTKVGHGKAE